jgi:hypothetical protein
VPGRVRGWRLVRCCGSAACACHRPSSAPGGGDDKSPSDVRRRAAGACACAPTHTAGHKCSPMLAVMRAFWWPIEAGGAVLAQRSRAGNGARHWHQLIVAAGTDCPRRLVTRGGTDAISIRTAQTAAEPSRGAGVRAGGHPRLPSGLAVHLGEIVRQLRQRANGARPWRASRSGSSPARSDRFRPPGGSPVWGPDRVCRPGDGPPGPASGICSLWIGLIVVLVGLIAFGGFARGRWY